SPAGSPAGRSLPKDRQRLAQVRRRPAADSTRQPLRQVAAVHAQELVGDVIRTRQGQEGDGTGDVHRLGQPAERSGRDQLIALAPLLVLGQRPPQARPFTLPLARRRSFFVLVAKGVPPVVLRLRFRWHEDSRLGAEGKSATDEEYATEMPTN